MNYNLWLGEGESWQNRLIRRAEFINYYRGDFFLKKNNKLDQLNMYYFFLRNSIIIALNYIASKYEYFCNSF